MSDLERERREIAAALQQPGLSPDPSLKLTRRTFFHKSCLFGAATVGQTKGAIGYVEYAYAKQNSLVSTKMVNHDGQTVAPAMDSFS